MRNRVLYPVGTINGRDHQMWPTLTRNELIALNGGTPGNPDDEREIDSVYPVGVSLDVIMKWMCRVREWTVAPSSLSASGNIYGGAPTAGFVAVWDMTWTTPEVLLHTRIRPIEGTEDGERDAFDEADMLGPWHNYPLTRDYTDPPGPDAWWKTLRNLGIIGGTGEGFALGDYILRTEPEPLPDIFTDFQDSDFLVREMNLAFSGGYVLFDADTQLFYPPIDLLLKIGISAQNGFQHVFFQAEVLPATPPSDPELHDISLGEMEIVGLSEANIIIPLGRKDVRSPTDDEAALGLIELAGSFDLTVTANQFWPYRTKAGDPVYDETTGEELEDPFS